MKTRILTAIGMAVIGVPLLIFSKYIVFAIVLSLLCLVALFELLRVIGIEKNYLISVPAYLIGLAFPTLAYFFAEDYTVAFLLTLAAALFLYLIYAFFVAVFMRGRLKFSELSSAFAAVTYAVSSFTAISVLRYVDVRLGLWSIVLMLVAAWGSDVFAYFTGRLIGRHKLIPEISPKKTIEGSIGGIVSAGALAMLLGLIVGLATDLVPNYLVLAICGVVLAATSQLGDLIASLIKREHGVKDYGNIFPGHGGVMDRFDSILSIATVLLAICILFPPFA